jgi:ubiquinone/menaquinone biosynthesis C-methylase UbiE
MTSTIGDRHRFLEEYRQIRYAEGRGSDNPDYYLALPYADLSGANSAAWAMRARTYRYFETKLLAPFERRAGRPLDILDLGAGNGWMSYRLSLRGHQPWALDIFKDSRDGLLAAKNYPKPFPLIEAEFDHLPFPASSFDLAIYNSSLHYSVNYRSTLIEAKRCLRRDGRVVVLDSPIYRRYEHGRQMVDERHANFFSRYGFRSDAIPSIEFLDEPALEKLANELSIRWTVHRPWYGWRWHLRPWHARLHKRRPPSRFWILIGRFMDL